MADRYWVGGTNTWNTTAATKWATTSGGAGGASVPTTADNVFFDAASGAVTVTVATTNGAGSINCTGFTGTLAFTAIFSSLNGSLTLSSGMTITDASFTFQATGTLTTAGKTLTNITINATGGTVTLGSALTLSGTLTVSVGTFTTSASNYAITASSLTASGSGTKTISLNASTVSLSSASSITRAFNYTGSNLTFNAGTSTINITSSSGNLNGNAGLTFNNVSFTSTSVSSADILGANTFSNLTLTAPASNDVSLYTFAANQTITTFVAAGASVVRRVFLLSETSGTRRTLTVTTWSTISDVDFRDIGMNSSRSGTRLGDCGNNSNITFAAAKTVYWNLTGTQDWSATGWATTSGGTPAVNNFPLAQDTAVFDNTGAATTVDISDPWNIGTLSMGSRTNAMTLSGGTGPSVYGNWTTGSGVTLSFTNTIKFAKTGTQTITSAGKSFFKISVEASSSLVLADALVTTDVGFGALFVGGNIDAVSYSVTTEHFTGQGTTALGTGTWTITGVFDVNGPWNQSALGTVTGSGEIILSNTTTGARTFAGGGKTYGKLTIGGATGTSTLTITGTNTFSEISSTKTVAHEIIFPNVTTTVGAFTVQGSAGNVVKLSRTGASGTFTLAKSGGGIVSSNYLEISNSTATPTNTWYAGANSTNSGGNTGWIFTNAPGGGKFLMFFI